MSAIKRATLVLSRLITSGFLMVSLGSCLCTLKPIRPPDAFEPNDTLEQAKTFTSPTAATLSAGEIDTFSFTANKNERLRFEPVTTSGGNLAYGLEVKTPTGELIATNKNPNPSISLEFVAPNTGNYVLVITGFYAGPADSFCAVGEAEYQITQINLGLVENPIVTVTSQTSRSITIQWSAVTGATSYALERQTAPDVWTALQTSSQRSFTDNNLQSDTAYTYRLKTLIGSLLLSTTLVETKTYKPYDPLLLSITTNIGNQYVSTRYVKNDITLSATLNDSPGTTVTLERIGAAATILTAPYSYVFPAGNPSIPEGEYSFSVTASRPGESLSSSPLVVVVDRTKPTIIAKSPTPNATLVPINSKISLIFSEELVVLGNNYVRLEKTADGALVPTVPSGTFTELILTPNTPLEPGVSYTVRVLGGGLLPGNGNTDRAGNAPDPESWSFTTQP
jgi:hypothetical protein